MSESRTMIECVVCGSPDVELRKLYNDVLRVTSDVRIWKTGGELGVCHACGMVQKPASETFCKDAEHIYATYQMYVDTGGTEQKIFTPEGPRPRSDVLLDQLIQLEGMPSNVRLLDVGCGAGNLLRAAGRRMASWELYGNDISSHESENILAIPGVKGFLAGEVSTIHETFDLVTLSHVLEHIFQPFEFLQDLKRVLKPNGVVAILVPNWMDNPFDLLVADHRSHFTLDHLVAVMQRAGYEVLLQDVKRIPKEMLVLARPAKATASTTQLKPTTVEALDGKLHWLRSVCAWAVNEKARGGDYAVLGTAAAAAWLTHAADLNPVCFVDENRDRQGLELFGKKVRDPKDVPATTRVLIPLPPHIADPLAVRLNQGLAQPQFLAPKIVG